MLSVFKSLMITVTAGSLFILGGENAYAFQEDDTQASPRARDLGIPFVTDPGPLNAITDVEGIEVGHVTLIEGEGALVRGQGPIRTGVTAIHPRGKTSTQPVFAGWFTLNASGDMTGTTWLEERGLIDGPILITNTHSVGVVRDAAVEWMVDAGWPALWHAPVVAETYDGVLNDINGFHVRREHALEALASATSGPVEEGAVGGGTGMVCNGFKGGIGTSSRQFELEGEVYTVGVLVQCNYGSRNLFTLPGADFGAFRYMDPICYSDSQLEKTPGFNWPYCDELEPDESASEEEMHSDVDGSIIVVIATDAPLLPHQLMRVAKRPALAIGRLGGISFDGSGDIFVAFSTANAQGVSEDEISTVEHFPNNSLYWAFYATVHATEEAILNAMVAADSMDGANGLRVPELPEDEVRELMRERSE